MGQTTYMSQNGDMQIYAYTTDIFATGCPNIIMQ